MSVITSRRIERYKARDLINAASQSAKKKEYAAAAAIRQLMAGEAYRGTEIAAEQQNSSR